MMRFPYVVIGGGVAGTCCANELCAAAAKSSKPSADDAAVCALISPTQSLKTVKVVKRISECVDELTVIEHPTASLVASSASHLEVIQAHVSSLDPIAKRVHLSDGRAIAYDKVCVCTGAVPKRPPQMGKDRVLTVRDTDSASRLGAALSGARRVVVAGNGAIALEVINKLRGLEVMWIVKHAHVGDALFDVDVARFLLAHRSQVGDGVTFVEEKSASGGTKGGAFSAQPPTDDAPAAQTACGHALGPQWTSHVGSWAGGGDGTRITILYHSEFVGTEDPSPPAAGGGGGEGLAEPAWPIRAVLSDGTRLGADVVINCTGVRPNADWLAACAPGLEISKEDGGVMVDERMETSIPGVFAAGDVCTLRVGAFGPHFFQMRLWGQAKVTAQMAAHAMMESPELGLMGLGLDLVRQRPSPLPTPHQPSTRAHAHAPGYVCVI